MEIKILVYIIAGIFWFIFNNKNKVKKDGPATNEIPKPVQQTSIPKVQYVDKQVERAKVLLNRAEKAEKIGIEKFSNPKVVKKTDATKNKIFIVPETEKFDAEKVFKITEIDSNEPYEQNSIGNEIGNDIRNGKIDLRQAVVINELLRPVYF